MLHDIKPPRKKELPHEDPKHEDVVNDFDDKHDQPKTPESNNESGQIHNQKRTLETPKYLLMVVAVVVIQNYSEIKNYFQSYSKNTDIAYASPLPETLRETVISEQSKGIVPNVPDNHLVVPVLGVDAPIQWSIADEKSKTDAALLNGVVQLANSALPGQGGNIYITGHSSNYAWEKSKYNAIFGHLDKLKTDDKIYLRYKNELYIYQVTEQKTLLSDDLSLVNITGGSAEQLSLVTCWPVGTSDKRLAVLAKRI